MVRKYLHRWWQYLFCAAVFLVISVFYFYKIWDLLNSDIATQLVLSELLSKEGSLLSKNWYYASELRVLGYNIFYAPLFALFPNWSWHLIRCAGAEAMFLVLELSILYFCRQLGISRYFWLIGSLVLVPFSTTWFYLVVVNTNYAPFAATSFFSIGLAFHTQKASSRKARIVLLAILAALALVTGMNGMRLLYTTYAPLFAAALFYLFANRKALGIKTSKDVYACEHFRFLLAAAVGLLFNLAGYLINSKYLSQQYSFQNFERICWHSFQISRLEDILAALLEALCFYNSEMAGGALAFSGGELFSIAAVRCALSFVLAALVVYALYKVLGAGISASFERSIIAFFIIGALTVTVVVFCFTTMQFSPGYITLWAVMAYPFMLLYYADGILTAWRYKKGLAIIIAAALVVCCADTLNKYRKRYDNGALLEIAAVLEQNGYQQGYATFWNANIMEELSNGYLEVWDWGDFDNDFVNIDQIYKWAQLKSHSTEKPAGRVFWILTEKQDRNFHFTDGLGEGHILCRAPGYVVYGFASYEEMCALTASICVNGSTLYPGTYLAVLRDDDLGDAMQELTVSCSYYGANGFVLIDEADISKLHKESGCISFFFTVDEEANNFNIDIGQEYSSIEIRRDGVWCGDFYDGDGLTNGYDDHGERHLRGGGISNGPYVSLPQGVYTVEAEGTGLDKLTLDFTSDEGTSHCVLRNVRQENGRISYEVTVPEYTEDAEARFRNNSAREVVLKNLRIQKKR